MRLGRLIDRLIDERGLNRHAVAEKLGIEYTRLSKICRRELVPGYLVPKVIEFFGLSVEEALAEMSPEEKLAASQVMLSEDVRAGLAEAVLPLDEPQRQRVLARLLDLARQEREGRKRR